MKNIFLILFACWVFTPVEAQWVVTVAGVLETPGFDDGPALSSRFFNPHGVAVDSAGMVYVADRFNHTIRRYNPISGTVKTLAGKPGENGDADGSGSDARFSEPWGICATPDGTIYVADTKNNKIRKVTPSGLVTTVAGSGNFGTSDGAVTTATFGEPTGIEVAQNGVIYVADHETHIIRKIENGTVTTLAGLPYIPGDNDGVGSEAQFWRPYGLTIDNTGDIIVADEWNHKIRKITPAGAVTTLAGIGETGLTDGEPDEARFHFPWDVTVDPEGNIYVADGFNYVIRSIATDGTVSTLAGTPQTTGGLDGIGANASFNGATSVAWSRRDTAIYVGDAYNHLVRAIYLDGLPAPVVSLNITSGSTMICEGEGASFAAFPDLYADYRFFLDGQLIQGGTDTELSLTNLQPGTFDLHVAADADGEVISSNTIIITVEASPKPTISAVGPLEFYEGDSVILIANGFGDFFWSNGSDEPAITVTESGAYFVEETIDGCTGASDTVVVNVIPFPEEVDFTFDGEPKICPGEILRLTSSAEVGNRWLKDGWPITGADDQVLEVTEGGFYQVQYTDPVSNITVTSEGQEITAVPESDFDFDASPRYGFEGQMVDFFSSGSDVPTSFSWDFGDTSSAGLNTSVLETPSHVFKTAGDYTVHLQATDQYGCGYSIVKEGFIRIVVDGTAGEGDIFLPTAFTPNGDGVNDIFRARGTVAGDFYLSVFNQWGESIFVSENPATGWDGNWKGQPVQAGTYAWMVRAETLDGTKKLSGYITLLR